MYVNVKRYLRRKEYTNDEKYNRIISYLPGCLPENSFVTKFPELKGQWSDKLNHPLVPETFSIESKQYAWWMCPKNKLHSWKAPIKDRT